LLFAAGAFIGTAPWSRGASASFTESVIYSFCAQGGLDCTDGATPAGVAADRSGDLFGTTSQGGADGGGTVFELTPNAEKTRWTFKKRYNFCAEGGEQCLDGFLPIAGLLVGTAGRLFGTTLMGGAYGHGTVFELIPGPGLYSEKVLYSFCARGGLDCTDGARPMAGLVADQSGDLFGTTQLGGAYGGGTVFELIPPKAGNSAWTQKVLYSFCAHGGIQCSDGAEPNGLTIDASGDLFGTTQLGGTGGVAFELIPPKAGATRWSYRVLHRFCVQGGANCTDGAAPSSPLL
jgi:uncharacterized repeat protein (TIGR03803 family)